MYPTVRTLAFAAPLAALFVGAPAFAGEDVPAENAETAKIVNSPENTDETVKSSPAPKIPKPAPETRSQAAPEAAKVITTAKADNKVEDAEAAPMQPAADAGPDGPVNGRIIHQASDGKICIGGVLCSKFCADGERECKPTESLTIKLDKPARINAIQLSAHDNIGATRRSRLVVKVNGKEVAGTLVYRLGSTLSIDVGETGELITIESAHQYNGFLRGGEEAVIWDVYVFGENQS
ncbi:MAG TPA: hypothetical protein VKN63_00370 [Afifellaceae bacterium]|nr:hypothetical protein [Afifellaceae bacterium]